MYITLEKREWDEETQHFMPKLYPYYWQLICLQREGMEEEITVFLTHRANTVLRGRSGSSELQMESPLSSEFSF